MAVAGGYGSGGAGTPLRSVLHTPVDNAAWFYSFRVLTLTEFMPGGIGLLAGVLYSWFEPERLGQRLLVPGALLVLIVIPFVKPLLDPIERARLRDHCDGEVYAKHLLHVRALECGDAAEGFRPERL